MCSNKNLRKGYFHGPWVTVHFERFLWKHFTFWKSFIQYEKSLWSMVVCLFSAALVYVIGYFIWLVLLRQPMSINKKGFFRLSSLLRSTSNGHTHTGILTLSLVGVFAKRQLGNGCNAVSPIGERHLTR